jgi:hypothetical protein
VIHGAPNATAITMSTVVATTQEPRVSTECVIDEFSMVIALLARPAGRKQNSRYSSGHNGAPTKITSARE